MSLKYEGAGGLNYVMNFRTCIGVGAAQRSVLSSKAPWASIHLKCIVLYYGASACTTTSKSFDRKTFYSDFFCLHKILLSVSKWGEMFRGENESR